MKASLTSFVSGTVFALGLGISGMTRPVKVIGFLDFFGAWDASLAFVMLGAIAVYFVAYRWSRKMPSPLLAPDFSLPRRSDLDARLFAGAAIFGAGWGLGGLCLRPRAHLARFRRTPRFYLRRCDGDGDALSAPGSPNWARQPQAWRSLRRKAPRMHKRSRAVDRSKSLNTSLTGAGGSGWFPRRSFLKMTAGIVADGIFGGSLRAFAAKLMQMPFENGGRKLVRFPQKGEMLLLRKRPPLLETPFAVFDQGVFTPNDQFFVRWHLSIFRRRSTATHFA